jgi:hypothetical protein
MKKICFLIIFLYFLCVYGKAQYTASSPISLSQQTNVVIDGKKFSSGTGGASIMLTNCSNVKIKNCDFLLSAGIIGIQLQNCTNVEISGNHFENFNSGVYAVSCKGGIDIHCNSFKNIAGGRPRGQMVQFNACSGAGNRVNYNTLDHTMGTGNPEDLINMYASSGTASDPLQIIGNQLRGGGPSTTGGGIIVGDNGGHDFLVTDNIIIDPGQYGIGVPAGYNITVKNNKIYAKQQSFTNVGLYVGLAGEIAAGYPCTGNTIRIEGNQVNWTNKNGLKNGWYNCPCCPGVTLVNNNFNAAITSAILPASLSLNNTACSSSPVNSLPLISITAPVNFAKFNAPASMTITAAASDADGTISKVEFYNGTTLLGSDLSAPYSYTWSTITAGNYSITAKAYDNLNASTTSTASVISVVAAPVSSAVGINGVSCITAGQSYAYTVVPESDNTPNISFWSNSAATITQDAGDKRKMTIQVPSYMMGTSFTLLAGVNYSVSPWYKEYTKVIKVGGCSARINASVSPQPTESTAAIQLENDQKIIFVIVYNDLGQEVYRTDNIESTTYELGAGIAPGLYNVIIHSEEGTTNTRFIKK